MNIRWRLMFSYLLVVLFTVAVLSTVLLWTIDRYYGALERHYLTVNAQGAASILAPMLARSSPSQEIEQQVCWLAFLSQARVRVWDPAGALLADSGTCLRRSWGVVGPNSPTPSYTGTLPAPLSVELAVEQSVIFDTTDTVTTSSRVSMGEAYWGYTFELQRDGSLIIEPTPGLARSHQVAHVPIQHEGQVLGEVELLEGPAYSRKIMGDVAWALSQVALVAILLGVVVGGLAGHQMSRPILSLAHSVRQMAQGNLAVRAEARGQDEIAMLARQFNAMAEHIQQAVTALEADREGVRRFAADASHEMHTPLTALASFIELLNGPRGADPSARAELLAEAERQVTRLSRLTSDLLDLACFDAGIVTRVFRSGDLRYLVQSVVYEHQPLAEQSRIDLETVLPDSPIVAQFDETYLRRALGNLMNNAIKFSPPGGKVTAGVQTESQMAEIWVADQGPGILPHDLPHVFERFYRGRSTQTQAGTGLGLAIVATVAEMHKGCVTVRSKEGMGSRFSIKIPLSLQT